jgi:hypothetical protein
MFRLEVIVHKKFLPKRLDFDGKSIDLLAEAK